MNILFLLSVQKEVLFPDGHPCDFSMRLSLLGCLQLACCSFMFTCIQALRQGWHLVGLSGFTSPWCKRSHRKNSSGAGLEHKRDTIAEKQKITSSWHQEGRISSGNPISMDGFPIDTTNYAEQPHPNFKEIITHRTTLEQYPPAEPHIHGTSASLERKQQQTIALNFGKFYPRCSTLAMILYSCSQRNHGRAQRRCCFDSRRHRYRDVHESSWQRVKLG